MGTLALLERDEDLRTTAQQLDLARAGARARRIAVTGIGALTPSERRVAEMAAGGMVNREIAQALFVPEALGDAAPAR